MMKYVIAAVGVAFAAAAMSAPAMAAKKKKAAPGKCGTYMYYDVKKKVCADKRK